MTARATPPAHLGRWSLLVVVAAVLFSARFVVVGADTYWAVALGRTIAGTRSIPDGIPFAHVPSAGWPNVPVLAELLLAAVASAGPVGIAALQLLVDAVALVLLAAGARRAGASDAATGVALALLVGGSLPALVSVKLQLFSVALVPVLLALLRADERNPSPRVWWVVPVLAVWGNLHGGVLVGLALTGCYLLASRLRRRPVETLAVGIAAVGALAANPAGLRTVEYYAGVLGNEAAQRGTQLWAGPDPRNVFDLLLIAAGLALVLLVLLAGRQRPPVWELLALVGLLAATVTSARHGIWLLMLCVAPAARRLTRGATPSGHTPPRLLAAVVAAVAAAAVALAGSAAVLATRVDDIGGSTSPALAAAVRQVADGRVVLADEPVAESLAAEGVRVWMSNPVDAFPRAAQAAYLDFVEGRPGPALEAADVVVVRSGSRADMLVGSDPRFAPRPAVPGWSLYARVG